MSDYDLLIKNVQIVDGTKAPAFMGSISVIGDRIAAVGDVKGDAELIIDAHGLFVSPGFIDVHNHGDLSILHYPRAESFVHQGITTFVGGNCGTSPGPYGEYVDQAYFLFDLYWKLAPDMYYEERLQPLAEVNELHKEMYGWEIDWKTLGEWMQRVEKKGAAANLVPIVGHGDVRNMVLGTDYRRKATRKEIYIMEDHISKAMEDGCRGLSVGRDYNPGYWAEPSELISCAEISAKYGGLYTSHSLRTGLREDRRSGDPQPPKINGILEAIDVGRKAKLSVEISHLSALYDVWPSGDEMMVEASVKATLKAIDNARSEGLDINFDLIPNTTGGIYSMPYLASVLLPWLRIAGGFEQFSRALAMPTLREEIKKIIMSGKWYSLNPNLTPLWAMGPTIVESKEERFIGKTVQKIADDAKMNPLDALMEIIRIDPYTKADIKGSDAAFLKFIKHPTAMIGIDTFSVDDKWDIKALPGILPNENTYGGFARYLRRCVRETAVLTLEEAINKVTSTPANKFRLTDRGILRVGAYADIVVFNLDTVTDRGDTLNPRIYPEGIEHVFVNGKQVIKDGKHTGVTPGKILRRENNLN
jgi:N-acyl-D-amino-acid deacylase